MKIYKYDVPDKMILNYCRIIKSIEAGTASYEMELARSTAHNEIFEHVRICRALDERDDREFNTALNRVVLELTCSPDDQVPTRLSTPRR